MDYKKYKDTVYQIIGAAMEVHGELNWGLLEPVYNEALHLELLDRGIENEREKQVPCYYKRHKLESRPAHQLRAVEPAGRTLRLRRGKQRVHPA